MSNQECNFTWANSVMKADKAILKDISIQSFVPVSGYIQFFQAGFVLSSVLFLCHCVLENWHALIQVPRYYVY